MNYRIPVFSAVEQREDKVKQLFKKFENHPNKESFLQHFKWMKEINKFSEESQDLIVDMNNTEIFEFCETSSKQQCPYNNFYWEAGIRAEDTSRSREMKRKSTRATTMQCRYPAMLSRSPAMDLLNNKEDFTRPEKCTESDIMPFDRIALENHRYVATGAERIRHSEHWILKLNQSGAQQPLNQRPDFAKTKRECKKLHDEILARTQQKYRTIPRS